MSNDDSSEYFIALPDCGLAEQGYFYEFTLSTPDEYPPEMSGKGPRPSPPRISSVPFVRSDDEVYCNLSAGFNVELHDCGLWDASEGISPHATGLVWNPTRLHAEVHNSKDVNALVPVWTNVGTRPLAKAPVAAALSGNMLLGFTLDPVRFSAGYGTSSELLGALEGSRFLQVWGRSCNVPWQVFGGPNACLSGCGHVIICPHCGAYFPTCPWCRRATTRYLFPSRSNDPDLPLMLMDGERGPCVDGARWDGSDIFHLGAARIGITQRFLNVLLEMQATSFHADPIGVLTEGMSDEQREWLVRAKGTA